MQCRAAASGLLIQQVPFMKLRFSIGRRIYCIIGLSFCGLIGLAMLQVNTLANSLKAQRQNELHHLGELAVNVAKEEYDAAKRDNTSEETARERAAVRIGKMRYGNGDYFWINNLSQIIMHPVKPELVGQDVKEIKDPLASLFFMTPR
jgi:methyl-accepting chemotaxis protein